MSGAIRGFFNDSANSLTSGQEGDIRATPSRALHINLRNQTGTEMGTAGNPLFVSSTAGSATDSSAFTAGSSAVSAAAGVFNDGMTNLASGQLGAFRITNQRALHVFVDNAGAGGVSAADGTAWVAATTATNPSGGVFNDSAAVLASGTEGTVRLTTNRAFHVNLRTAAAVELLGQKTMAGSLPVAIASDQTAFPVSQSGGWSVTANIGTSGSLALDTSVSGILISQGTTLGANKGPMVMGSVTTAAPGYTTGQISPLSLNLAGGLRVDGSGVTQPVSGTVTANQGGAPWSDNLTQIGGVSILAGNGVTGTGSIRVTIASDNTAFAVNATCSQATAANLNAQVVGTVAAASADSGNPVKVGGVYLSAPGTILTSGNRSNQLADGQGRDCVTAVPIAWIVNQATTITASTAETTIVTAGAAGIFNDLVFLMLTNSSATATSVTIRDATAGTTRFIIDLAANGGAVVPIPSPGHPQAAAAANWTAQSSASITSLHITAICHQRK